MAVRNLVCQVPSEVTLGKMATQIQIIYIFERESISAKVYGIIRGRDLILQVFKSLSGPSWIEGRHDAILKYYSDVNSYFFNFAFIEIEITRDFFFYYY